MEERFLDIVIKIMKWSKAFSIAIRLGGKNNNKTEQ